MTAFVHDRDALEVADLQILVLSLRNLSEEITKMEGLVDYSQLCRTESANPK